MIDDIVQQKREKIFITIAVVASVFIMLISFFLYSRNQYSRIDDINAPIVQQKEQQKIGPNPFDKISLSAKSAVVWDVKNKKFLFQKNETEVMPLASLSKLMTAMTASEIVPENTPIRITAEYLEEGSDPELYVGDRWSLKNLTSLTLITSSNAGARALASVAGAFLPDNIKDSRTSFLNHINTRAKEIGLNSTNFYNDNGLDIDDKQSGAYGTAEDMAKLMDYILNNHRDLLDPTTNKTLQVISGSNIVHKIKNTNTIVEDIPGILGSKTGYTDLAQGNLVVAFSPGLEGPYVAVVMGSTFDGRFSDVEALVSATLKTIAE